MHRAAAFEDVAILEREAELDALGGQLDRCARGDGSLVVVEGPAGIGKTTLLRAAAALAQTRGLTVLRGRGGVLERHLEHGVVRQLLERPVLRADAAQRAALLAGPAAQAAAVIGAGELPADDGAGLAGGPDPTHALYWLVANLAEAGPLLLIVDDAHWCDAASLRTVAYLARRLDGLPVALLFGTRDDEPGSAAADLVALLGGSEATWLRPEPLSATATGTVLTAAFAGVAPAPAVVDACARASGGNPFFVTELAAELAASHAAPARLSPEQIAAVGPLAVRRSLLLRLGLLGDDAGALARAVATLGGEGELRHAAAIAALTPEAAAAAADTLAAAGIVEDGRPLRIVHPLVRAAIAEDMPTGRLAAAHRRAFETLRADGADDDAVLPHVLAMEPAGDPATSALLLRTSDRALRTGAPDAAAVHLRRALAEPPPLPERAPALAALGRAEVRQGAFEDGIGHLGEALAEGSGGGLTGGGLGPAERLAVERDRAFAAFAGRGIDAARGVVRDAIGTLATAGGGEDDALQLEADLALLAWLTDGEHQLDLRRHRAVPGDTRAERTILALLSQEEHARGAPPGEVVELAERALGGGRLIAHDTSEALSWYMATYSLLTCEAHDAARATIAAALEDGRRRGSAFAIAGALGTRAVLALNEGRPRDAEADARTAAEGAMPPTMAPVNASYVALALIDQGDLDGAAAELGAAGIAGSPGGPTVMRWITWANARLAEARGDAAAVRTAVEPLRGDDEAGRPMRALAWRALLARALSRGGATAEERAEAAALADAHLVWARGWARPAALGVAQRAHALTAEGARRIELLEEAVATLSGSASRTEEARARLDLGVALLRAGRRRDGRAALEAALDCALACGARGTAEAAAAELEIAGAPPRRLGFDELTASERRIAELAAGGRTNRTIADELFVTPKTVENHLTRVYAKLGIDGRTALAGALAETP